MLLVGYLFVVCFVLFFTENQKLYAPSRTRGKWCVACESAAPFTAEYKPPPLPPTASR